MTTSAEYRKRAAEAEALAYQLSRHDHRDEALRIAEEWRRLADALDGRPRSFAPSE